MFYPVAVMVVAVGIMILLMVMVVPKFKEVFGGMDMTLPGFTQFVLDVSDIIKIHFLMTAGGIAVFVVLFLLFIKTKVGRHFWDKVKLTMPPLGQVVSKVAISRFTRTLGTLVSS